MEQCLQSCLDSISRWSDHWQLTLSSTNCTVLHVVKFGRHADCFKYFIGDHAIPTVTYVTDIGVSRDDKLSLVPHIDNICTKATPRAKLILKRFQTHCRSVLSRAYCTFCSAHIRICI